LLGGLLALVLGIFLLCWDFTKPKIKNGSDLTFCTGPFESYSWVKRGRGSSLTSRLENYSTNFKVKADFFSILKQKEFKAIRFGTLITIGIPNRFTKYLKTSRNFVFVYEIADQQETYLDYTEAIEIYNSNLMKIFSIILTLVGLAALYYWHKSKTTNYSNIDANGF
jgi:hypothetical protein